MTIITPRLLIRPVAEEDWQSIRDIWKDFFRSDYAIYDRPRSTEDEDVRSRIALWAKAATGTDHMFFVVCLQGTVIG